MNGGNRLVVSVASFNVFGAPFYGKKILRSLFQTRIFERFQIIADYFSKADVDIITLQEVHTFRQLRFLKKRMQNFPHVIYKKLLYGPKGGVVIFSKIPFEHVAYIDFKKRGTIFNKTVVAKIGKRGILVGKLKNSPVYILNAHLTQNSDHDWSPQNKHIPFLVSQLKQVAQTIASFPPKHSVIVTGDFNMPKHSIYYDWFIKLSGIKDAFDQHNSATYHKEFLKLGDTVGRVDYIFTTKTKQIEIVKASHIFKRKLKLVSNKITYVSDHIGLKANISLQYLPRD
ncbi:MAG: endonuclease/exonuclease/phosphatase family protein [Candidatus Levybacteria bacterium]|nr:endonuclease/exonuclease/phosphatase family protein [Candidatus Levybacteria bacterium]